MRVWKNLKRWVLVGGLVLFLASNADADSVIDAPHNETNEITCGQCHTYSLWWNFSPATSLGITNYRGVADGVCNKCHGPGEPFSKMGHSSASMGQDYEYPGAPDGPGPLPWARACVECHDPHLQAQLKYLPENPEFNDGTLAGGVYLAEGTMSGIPATPIAGQMTFDFTNGLAKAGWTEVADWSMKSGNEERGLILVLGYGSSEKTYEITAATATTPIPNALPADGAGTITVQVGSDPIPDSYEGTNFGITYGQLIKSAINTRDELDATNTILPRTVKFFDSKNGGLIDGDDNGIPTGICLVCHYNTTFNNQNGLTPHPDYGLDCTTCHPIAKGFRPDYLPHDDFIARTTASIGCGGCHSVTNYPDLVADLHQSNCAKCHLNGEPPALFPSYTRLMDSAVITPAVWPTADVEDDAVTPNLGHCGQCHGTDYFLGGHLHKDDHSGQVDAAVPNCTSACHFHNNKDVITGIHDSAGAGGTAACDKCHDLANGGPLKAPGGAAQAVTPGDCTGCHTTIALRYQDHPATIDHTGQVEFNLPPAPSCSDSDPQDAIGCHDQYDAALQVHPNQCATCHETNGALKSLAKDYYAGGTATCSTCHPDYTHQDSHWDAPYLKLNSTTLAYAENDPATAVDSAAVVNDIQGQWGAGTLTVQITANSELSDQLSIIPETNIVDLNGAMIIVDGTYVGDASASSVAGSDILTITFTIWAENTDVQKLVRHIGYQSTSSDPLTASRTVTLTLTDAQGNSAAISTASRTIEVTAMNDAPVASGHGALAPVNEDEADPLGAAATDLFTGSFSDPAEGDLLAGIAIVSNTVSTEGSWEFFNGSWLAVGAVSQDNALLVAADDALRFVPAPDFNGELLNTLTVHLVEDSAGAVASGTIVDLSAAGTTGADTVYSAAAISLNTSVAAVNDAPLAAGDGTLAAADEDSVDPVGGAVADLFAISYTEPADGDALAGVAIVSNTASTEGSWQYFNGSWLEVGAVTQDNALLVAAGDALRFVPAPDFNGELLDTLTMHLVENSAGVVVSGTIVDLSAAGATGADTVYSAAAISLNTSVAAVNDAPLAAGDGTLAAADEDSVDPVGGPVADLFAISYTEPADGDALAGVAIVSNTASTEGSWQYFNGSWLEVGAVSLNNALLVAAGDALRFVPAPDFNGELLGTLTMHLVEDSAGAVVSGNFVDLNAPGATGADTVYSVATVNLDTSIVAVADAPNLAIDDSTPLSYTEGDGVVALDGAAFLTDPEQDWNLGTLAVQISSNSEAADQLSVITDGVVTMAALQISVNGTYIADASAALVTGTQLLTVTFNAAATDADVQAVAQHIGYENVSATPSTAERTVTYTATDAGAHTDAGSTAIRRIEVTDLIASNSAPLASGDGWLTSVEQDTTPPGAVVASCFFPSFSDPVDGDAFAGIAVVANTANGGTQGFWYYFDGSDWQAITGSPDNALIIAESTAIMFWPVPGFNGDVFDTLTVHLIEDSAGPVTTGTVVDLSLSGAVGGSTVYSAATVYLDTAVTPAP